MVRVPPKDVVPRLMAHEVLTRHGFRVMTKGPLTNLPVEYVSEGRVNDVELLQDLYSTGWRRLPTHGYRMTRLVFSHPGSYSNLTIKMGYGQSRIASY